MLGRLREWTCARCVLVVLALLALTLKIAIPPGFMAGTSLAAPIVLCPDQALPVAMAHGGHHSPKKHAPQRSEQPCPFAGLAAVPVLPDLRSPVLAVLMVGSNPAATPRYAVAPGRGMAAPPPPSHAPPVFRV